MFPKPKICKLNEEHLDAAIQQVTIMKNYLSMTETYLKMVRANLGLWHSLFIDTK